MTNQRIVVTATFTAEPIQEVLSFWMEQLELPFEIDFAPLLRALHDATVDCFELDAIDRADFETRLAAGAVVGVNDRQFLGNFFAWSFFGHGRD